MPKLCDGKTAYGHRCYGRARFRVSVGGFRQYACASHLAQLCTAHADRHGIRDDQGLIPVEIQLQGSHS